MDEPKSEEAMAKATRMAYFRFSLIAPVIQGTYTEESETKYYKRVTAEPLKFPDGRMVRLSYKTLERWTCHYRHGGMDELMPHERNDKGSTRALSDEAVSEIFNLKNKYPRINATQIHALLVKNSVIPATVSVCAVQRFIRKNDLKYARPLNIRDRKAFEEDSFGRMWQADTCYFPEITADGKKRKTYAIAIIDDHSRLIVGAKIFYNDSATNFQKVLKDAISTYGIPDKLMVDNGCSYANEQLTAICLSLSVVLIHNKPRDAAAKAKIERSLRTCRERFLSTLDVESIHTLDEFNKLYAEYVRAYNLTEHSGIGCKPMERYLASKDDIRPVKSLEWLDECFLNRVVRKVRKDATVSINKIFYDVPQEFICQSVEIRYVPDDMSTAFILYEKERYPIVKTDKVANCHTRRNNNVIDYSKLGGEQ